MLLTIFFNPVELHFIEASKNDVYIVLDVMRATTTLAVMFDQGAKQVLAAQTIEQAREAAQQLPNHLLCGEYNTKIPPGFDYNNSPAQFAQLDLSGRDLILATSNGTRAIFACPKQSTRLAGSFYNAQAVVSYALALARGGIVTSQSFVLVTMAISRLKMRHVLAIWPLNCCIDSQNVKCVMAFMVLLHFMRAILQSDYLSMPNQFVT